MVYIFTCQNKDFGHIISTLENLNEGEPLFVYQIKFVNF